MSHVLTDYAIDCERAGIGRDDADTLRRAALTLHRWAEMECGDGNDYASWAIERDEETGKPYLATYPHSGKAYRRAIPDREAGAQRRVNAIAARLGAKVDYQGDPRGNPFKLELSNGRTLYVPPVRR